MATLILSDTWPNDNYSHWDHSKMLEWISHLNTTFFEQYNDEFLIAKVNGSDFELLSDLDYLIHVFGFKPQHAASFSNILVTRMDNYVNNQDSKPNAEFKNSKQSHNNNSHSIPNIKSLDSNQEIQLKRLSSSIQDNPLQPPSKPVPDGMLVDTVGSSNNVNAPPLQTRQSIHAHQHEEKSLPPSATGSPILQSPHLQPIQAILPQFSLNGDGYHNGLSIYHEDFDAGPQLPLSHSILPLKTNVIAQKDKDKDKEDKEDEDDEDDDMYEEHSNILTPETPKTLHNYSNSQQLENRMARIGSAYDTPKGHDNDNINMNDNYMDSDSDNEMYKPYKTKNGFISVEQSETDISSHIDAAAILSDIDEDEIKQNIHEIHKNNQGIAQLLLDDNDHDFEQFEMRLNQCKKIWNKHGALDINIQFILSKDNNLVRCITLQCLRKLEQLLITVGGQQASALFFSINAEFAKTKLQSLLTGAHTNHISNTQIKYEIFSKLKSVPNVTKRQGQNNDFAMMISINFDIEYNLIKQKEDNYKHLLINELSIILEIHESLIQILSSGPGNGSCWHLNIKIEMWSYLHSLTTIEIGDIGRRRNILKYQLKTEDEIDVKKKNKWYLCKIKTIKREAKYLETKGENIRIKYIGKYVENRNGQIILERGKPFKLSNTEWIWSMEDKHRIRSKELNVQESISNQYLKIAFRK